MFQVNCLLYFGRAGTQKVTLHLENVFEARVFNVEQVKRQSVWYLPDISILHWRHFARGGKMHAASENKSACGLPGWTILGHKNFSSCYTFAKKNYFATEKTCKNFKLLHTHTYTHKTCTLTHVGCRAELYWATKTFYLVALLPAKN